MADELLDKVRDALDGPIDFEGQRLAEQLTTNILAVVGVLAFVVGYFTQNITYTLYVGLAGTALTFLAIIPPWPVFNKHPAAWLPSRTATSGITVTMDKETDG